MLENFHILTPRRAYEFHIDDLRISMLSTKPVQDQIQQLFQFQSSTMGTPMPTFGEVPITFPPGFVYNMGAWIASDEQLVPIRFLHFEQRRIVIDVAGPSSAIDAIFAILRQFFSVLHAPDGSPIIGEPDRVLEYSEITAKLPFEASIVLPPSLQKVFATHIGHQKKSNPQVTVPALTIEGYDNETDFAGVNANNNTRSFTFTLRAGTKVKDHIYFSGAPLNSEAHLAYLEELVTALRSLC